VGPTTIRLSADSRGITGCFRDAADADADGDVAVGGGSRGSVTAHLTIAGPAGAAGADTGITTHAAAAVVDIIADAAMSRSVPFSRESLKRTFHQYRNCAIVTAVFLLSDRR
jgi:hypothetical protein